MRAFLAIEVPATVRKIISDFVENEADKGLPIKWVKFENMHITLKFLAEIDEGLKAEIVPVVSGIVKQHGPFMVQLGGLGCFPTSRNPRVIWVGLKQGGDEISAVAAELEEELARFGFKEERRFHPHLTIGRVKSYCKVENILTKTISTEPFHISSLVLFESTLKPEGPIYTVLDKFSFS